MFVCSPLAMKGGRETTTAPFMMQNFPTTTAGRSASPQHLKRSGENFANKGGSGEKLEKIRSRKLNSTSQEEDLVAFY